MNRNSQEFQDYLRVKAQLLNHFADLAAKYRPAVPASQIQTNEPCRKMASVEKAPAILP